MAIRTKTTGQLNQKSFEFLLRNTDITLLTPGSTARALVESANRHLEGFYESLSVNLASAHLSTAKGVYLDLIGDLFGLPRRRATTASIVASDRALRFYVQTGTLHDRLPNPGNLNEGLVPTNTQVTNDDGTVVFTVDEDVTFPRTATEVFVPARAETVGSIYNVGAFVLRNHSLGDSDVLVTNPTSINTGQAEEDDASYRSRIADFIVSSEGANRTSVRLAALSAPGVADVNLIPFLMGAGSFDVLLTPVGNRISQETMLTAKRNIESTVAFGMAFRVREPDYVRFSLVIRLVYTSETLPSAQDSVRSNVERAVLDYFGNIPIGQELVLTELGAIVRGADDRVYDYKVEAMCLNGRLQLPHNFRLMEDQLFIPDENLDDPVRVI